MFLPHLILLVSAGCLLIAPWAFGETPNSVPRPEHPTPQMARGEWLNLNGTWEFAETDDNAEDAFLKPDPYPDHIVVPFCRESKLAGLERQGFIKNVWYRRTFSVPAAWNSPRVLLHIGACDWKTRVWVNKQFAGEHVGGSAAFASDVTKALKSGENTVIIHAFDDTRSGLQATGKQSHELESNGCVYTRTTGIWQTVWLEGVGDTYIREFFITPEPAPGRVVLQVEMDGPTEGLAVQATAFANEKEAGAAGTQVAGRNEYLVLNLREAHLWSLEDPFLYGLKIALIRGETTVDAVDSYFGLRGVSIQGAAILINHKAVFQRLVLDQGFYPEGVWTAPSDAALKHDIELSKAAGFNGARLHQKVFEPRYLYWADRLGYLVWGEFPSWGANVGQPAVDLPILNEWIEVVRSDRNHPAIIGWCPFNETSETWGPLQNVVVHATRQIDPTRPALDTSGYFHSLPDPELLDAHDYNQDPVAFRAHWDSALSETPIPPQYTAGSLRTDLPFFVSEYGGIGWNIHGKGWGYGNAPADPNALYERFAGLSNALLDNRRMFGFCYTQLTDIEQEQNGIYTYDRAPKFDCDKLKAILSRPAAYEKDPPVEKRAETPLAWKILVGAFPDGDLSKPWRYTMEAPPERWMEDGFDEAKWEAGRGGFGRKGGWENRTRTPWKTKDIWLRQEFAFDGSPVDKAALVIHYDNGTEVYVNGKEVWSGKGWNDNYAYVDVTRTVRETLRAGKNLVAVHCHQDEGGQFIDLALLTLP